MRGKNSVIFARLIQKFFIQCKSFRMSLLQCGAKGQPINKGDLVHDLVF